MNTTNCSNPRAGVLFGRHALGGVVFIILIGLLLVACGTPTPGSTTPPPGKTSVPQPNDTPVPSEPPQTISKDIVLDPAIATDADSLLVDGYIYEGLVKLENGAPAAALAVSQTVSEDGLHYTFNLRPGVVFHDGTPLSADVVLANFNRWFDPDDPLHGSATYAGWKEVFFGFKGEVDANGGPVSSFDGIEKADNLTILIHLNREMPDLLDKLSGPAFALASPEALAKGETAGTGPYQVGEKTAQKLVLQPNTHYWDVVPSAALEFALK
jgi:peptide/nickel transport system substrate-binding protein